MLFEVIHGAWVVVVHNEATPEAHEWNKYLEMSEKFVNLTRGFLVHTAGGTPTALQRGQLKEIYVRAGRKPPITAVLGHHSPLLRVAVGAMGWVFPDSVKLHEIHELDEALKYLIKPPDGQISAAMSLSLRRMTHELGIDGSERVRKHGT